jgi:hypothetical protein
MATTAQTILDKVARELHDISGLRWTRPELLAWLNDGLRQIVLQQPTATNTVSSVKLVAGTRQTLPTGSWLLFNVVRNMGTDGATAGRAARIISRELLNAFNPNWHADTATSEIRNFIYDLADQTHFFVYPPNNGTGYVELNYSVQPTDLTAESQTIPMFDIYQQALADYILYRACMKNVDYAQGAQLAAGYLATFTAALGAKENVEIKATPEQALGPRNVSAGGSDS